MAKFVYKVFELYVKVHGEKTHDEEQDHGGDVQVLP